MSFDTLGLSKVLLKAIHTVGYTKPTPIQKDVIPLVLDGVDVMAQAHTGSGKTAAFVLPILQSFFKRPARKKAKPRVLVLTPTRELTQQVSQSFLTLSEHFPTPIRVVSVVGGERIGEQLENIQKGCDVIVATTGRLLEIISKQQLHLQDLEYFVLDEADKMLDLGFIEALQTILELMPKKRQNLLFSATYTPKVLSIASHVCSNFKEVGVTKTNEPTNSLELITQRVIEVNRENRSVLLRTLLKEHNYKKVLVFMATKRATDNVASKFRKYGFRADSFHGNLIQEERSYTLEAFKNGELQILFCTDIAARGLHIEDIDCVVNYDLSRSPEDYIHRIGRTGRVGKKGVAITFIDYETMAHFKLIEKRCKLDDSKVVKEQIAGFELTGEAPKKVKGPAPVKGKRKSKKDKLREQQREENK